jgi:transcriptional regulator with PAS, ATPase and Fis domain
VAQIEANSEVGELRRWLDIEYGFDNIIGNSPAMRRIYRTILQVAASAGTILLIGESGTGKELIARAIHRNSPRQHNQFIALNCAGTKTKAARLLRIGRRTLHRKLKDYGLA